MAGVDIYKNYNYGVYRKEIRALLRKHLTAKERIRQHSKKVEKWTEKLAEIDKELEQLFEKAKRGF